MNYSLLLFACWRRRALQVGVGRCSANAGIFGNSDRSRACAVHECMVGYRSYAVGYFDTCKLAVPGKRITAYRSYAGVNYNGFYV